MRARRKQKNVSQIDKDATLPIRMRQAQRDLLDLAAAIESLRRPHRIGTGPLLLELGIPAAEQIVSSAAPEERRQAEALVTAA